MDSTPPSAPSNQDIGRFLKTKDIAGLQTVGITRLRQLNIPLRQWVYHYKFTAAELVHGLGFTGDDFKDFGWMKESFEFELHEVGIFPRAAELQPVVANTEDPFHAATVDPFEYGRAKHLAITRVSGVRKLRDFRIPLRTWLSEYTIAELCALGFKAHDFDHWKDATDEERQQLRACSVLVAE